MTPRRLHLLPLACLAVAAALLAGCGGGNKNVDVGPAAAVPQNAAIYLDATVKPTGTTKANSNAALGKILKTSDPGGKIVSLIDQQKTNTGQPVNYATDIAPWLGQKIGLFFTKLGVPADGAAVIETTNPSSALAFVQKANGTSGPPKSIDGVSYQLARDGRTAYGTEGNLLLVGNEAGVQSAIKAEKGSSLGDSSEFKDAIGDLPTDRLGTVYTVPKTLLAALPASSLSGQSLLQATGGEALTKPAAGALSATADSVQLDLTGGNNGVETPESSLIGSVPSQSWLVIGDANLGATVKQAINQAKASNPSIGTALSQIQATTGASIDQLTGALGNAVVYVEGTTSSTVTGALLAETKDPGLTGRLLGQLRGLAQISGGRGLKPLSLSGGGTGFQIVAPTIQQPIEIAQQGNKLVLGYGAGSAQRTLAPAGTLDSSPTFTKAKSQVSSLGTDFFLSFPDVFKLVESGGSTKKNPGFALAKPYLDTLEYLASGSGTKSGKTEVKIVVGLK